MSDLTQRGPQLNRRELLRLTGAAGLGAALAPSLGVGNLGVAEASPADQAAVANTQGAGFYRFTIGEYELAVVSDGNSPPGRILPTFGANPDKQTEFEQLLRDNYIDPSSAPNQFNLIYINTGKQRILFDTGFGAGNAGPSLGKAHQHLANMGVRPNQIDHVVYTHFHGDHLNGTTVENRVAYPNAAFHVGLAEWDFWVQPVEVLGNRLANTQGVPGTHTKLKAIADRIGKTIRPGEEPLPGVHAMFSPGHTPGHMSYIVHSKGDSVLLTGDAVLHSLINFEYPDSYSLFDQEPWLAIESRKRLLDMAAAEKMLVVGYHFPFPGMGHVRKRGNAWQWVPIVWRF